jgi:sRNA-binding carbon storage regulator CsrA
MLVLGRKVGDRIVVPQCRLTITVGSHQGNTAKTQINGPKNGIFDVSSHGIRRTDIMDGTSNTLMTPARSAPLTKLLPYTSRGTMSAPRDSRQGAFRL